MTTNSSTVSTTEEKMGFSCPKFTEQSNLDIKTFFKIFESVCLENKIVSEDEKKKALRKSLEGESLTYFINYCDELPDFESIKNELILFFDKSSNVSFDKFVNIKLDATSNIDEYFRTKLKLGKELHLPQEILIEGLTNGLPQTFRTIISAHDVESTSKWISIVRRMAASERHDEGPHQKEQTPQLKYSKPFWPRMGYQRQYLRPDFQPRPPVWRQNYQPRPVRHQFPSRPTWQHHQDYYTYGPPSVRNEYAGNYPEQPRPYYVPPAIPCPPVPEQREK